jgi:hypothetical protein
MPTSEYLSDRDLEMLALGRSFERSDILKLLKKSAQDNIANCTEHSIQVGFMIEAINKKRESNDR